MADTNNYYTATDLATMVWPKVITPEAYAPKGKAKGKPKFSAQYLLDPEGADYQAIKTKAVAAAKAVWPGADIGALYREGKLHMPFEKGDIVIEKKITKAKEEGKEYNPESDAHLVGKIVLSTSTGEGYPPKLSYLAPNGAVLDVDRLDPAQLAMHKGKFYGGVQAAYSVALKGTEVDGKKFVSAYLQSVMSANRGKQIGGRLASETFSGFAGKVSEADPTVGTDIDGL